MKKTPKKVIRLKEGSEWVKTYLGKNIVKGYARHFAVDKLFAVKELKEKRKKGHVA